MGPPIIPGLVQLARLRCGSDMLTYAITSLCLSLSLELSAVVGCLYTSRDGPLSGETHILPERHSQVSSFFFYKFCKPGFCVTRPSTVWASCTESRPVTCLPLYVLGIHTATAEPLDHTRHDRRKRRVPMSSADTVYAYMQATYILRGIHEPPQEVSK